MNNVELDEKNGAAFRPPSRGSDVLQACWLPARPGPPWPEGNSLIFLSFLKGRTIENFKIFPKKFVDGSCRRHPQTCWENPGLPVRAPKFSGFSVRFEGQDYREF